MFDALKRFVLEAAAGKDKSGSYPHLEAFADTRIAEAALMFHVIAADGVVKDEERNKMTEVLEKHFDLSPEDTSRLVKEAREADLQAIDLFTFTSTLKREMGAQERINVIENLWEMVYADGEIHELEDNVVWRVADLLDVDGRDRIDLKQRVRLRREDNSPSVGDNTTDTGTSN